MLAALGVVFGDIGTSPLYALQTVFSIDDGAVRPTVGDVYGVISLMFWSVTLIVSVKYVGVLMRADNDGEGGVMALAALARRLYSRPVPPAPACSLGHRDRRRVALLRRLADHPGDQRAVRGRGPAGRRTRARPRRRARRRGDHPGCLFAAQRFGTGKVGGLFGPVTLLWFAAMAAAGLGQIVAHPEVAQGALADLRARCSSSPTRSSRSSRWAPSCWSSPAPRRCTPTWATSAGPRSCAAWFFVVFPALTLNYLGQAALILHHPGSAVEPVLPAASRAGPGCRWWCWRPRRRSSPARR